jgi:hypothetical protein
MSKTLLRHTLIKKIFLTFLHMVFTSRNWFVRQGPVAIILISWNVIFIWETGYWIRAIKRFALFDLNVKNTFTSHIDKKNIFDILLTPYLYTFLLYENPSFIIFSAETEYISTRSWYRNINVLRDRTVQRLSTPSHMMAYE